jgi:UPF0042 nucleotide-binding protein
VELVVISGRSGSGKSTALHQLEDEGYYAIDNLPASLLPALVAETPSLSRPNTTGIAVCIDARNAAADLGTLEDILGALPASVRLRVLFLDADENTLIKRFSETRRRHPLSNENTPLAEAIRLEQEILEPLAANATLTLDTSQMSIHELRDAIRQRLVGASGELSTLIQSFGFKRGVPADADLVFDLRMLPNPHWSKELRLLTGRDAAVRDFLEAHEITQALFDDISGFVDRWLPHYASSNRSYITIALGCTGGQHRSVYMAERLHRHIRDQHGPVHLRHRELQ